MGGNGDTFSSEEILLQRHALGENSWEGMEGSMETVGLLANKKVQEVAMPGVCVCV